MTLTRREFGYRIGGIGTLAAASSLGFVTFELEGCAPASWIDVAIKDLPIVINIATTVATIVADALGGGVLSPAIAAAIQAAAKAAQVALALVQQLVADYQANPSASIIQKIETALTDVQSQLNAILDAAHIDNAALRATISGIIGLALTVVAALISILPQPKPVPAGAKVSRVPIKPMSPKQIRNSCNAILSANGYQRYHI
jgi:hypothetical protein